MQHTHYSSTFSEKYFPIVLGCEEITNSVNVGSLFRVADTFGIEQIIFCGDDITIDHKVKRTSRSTEKRVKFSFSKNIVSELIKLRNKNYLLTALEITDDSAPLHDFKFEVNSPLALVVGAENSGVSEVVLNMVDERIHIEMFGQNSSMNVAVATGIALYEITRQNL